MPMCHSGVTALSPFTPGRVPPRPNQPECATFPFCFPLQLITVYSLPGMDPDWLIGERGNKKGKVPVTYLELLS